MAFNHAKPLHNYTLISVRDPAIDPDRSDLDAYESDYLYDPARLVLREGELPTLFHCRPLSQRLVVRLLDRMMRGREGGEVEVYVHEAALLSFRYGVSDIENLPGFDPQRHIQQGNPPAIKESWLDKSGLPVDVVVEIGSVILAKSRLSETDRKN